MRTWMADSSWGACSTVLYRSGLRLLAAGLVLTATACGNSSDSTRATTPTADTMDSSKPAAASNASATVTNAAPGGLDTPKNRRLVILASGFSQFVSDGKRVISYAVILKNTANVGAPCSWIRMNFFTADGTLAHSMEDCINYLPAGATGVVANLNGGEPVKQQIVRMTVVPPKEGGWDERPVPGGLTVTGLSFHQEDDYSDYDTVSGSIRSTFERLIEDPDIVLAYYDHKGTLIGAWEITTFDTAVPAGGKGLFEETMYELLPPPGAVRAVAYATPSESLVDPY